MAYGKSICGTVESDAAAAAAAAAIDVYLRGNKLNCDMLVSLVLLLAFSKFVYK